MDALAALPASRALAKARECLAEAVQAEEAAAAEFRIHCKRVGDAQRWTHHDALATKAETEALKTAAARRLASIEAETIRRANGESLNKHLARHEAACFEILLDELRTASATARRIAKAVAAAEQDGASPTHRLRKVRRAANELRGLLVRMES